MIYLYSHDNIRTASIILIIFITYIAISACSSSSSSNKVTEEVTAPLVNSVKHIELTAGQSIEIVFSYTIPGPISSKGDFSLDLSQTLQSISLSSNPVASKSSVVETLSLLASIFIKDVFAAESETTQVTAFLSYNGDPDVCSSSTRFGPYSITGAIDAALVSATTTVEPTQHAIDIMNSGSFDICLVTIPPINAYLTIPDVAVNFKACAQPTVSIENSVWSGEYQCTNFGSPDDPLQSISLEIFKNSDGSYEYIDNEGAIYTGHLCGNSLKFNGGEINSYTESGTLKFSSNTTATKTSIWNSIPPGLEGGNCSDTLQRIIF